MKKFYQSTWFAILLVIVAGAAMAYRRYSRSERASDAANKARIEADVKQSIGGLNIEMKPLTEAGASK